MIKITFIFLLILIIISTVLHGEIITRKTSETEGGGKLLLKSGFEEGVEIAEGMEHIKGSDYNGFEWETTMDWIRSSRFVYLVSSDKPTKDFMESRIETMAGPYGDQTNVLRLINKADDPNRDATSRNEFSFFGEDPPNDFKEGYVCYWMKLQENLKCLVPYDKESDWYMIMEWKEPNSGIKKSAADCIACCDASAGGTNNYRININIGKNAKSDKFFWRIRGEHPQPCREEEWRYENMQVKVPVGEWFMVEAYLKKDSAEGRIYFAVNEEVVLDTNIFKPDGFTGRTEHPDNPLPLHFWSPIKNYHAMVWNAKGPISQWYDDFELWSSFPPGHPALNGNKSENNSY